MEFAVNTKTSSIGREVRDAPLSRKPLGTPRSPSLLLSFAAVFFAVAPAPGLGRAVDHLPRGVLGLGWAIARPRNWLARAGLW